MSNKPVEIYVSTDVEVDGPIPGPHSMLSLASAAFGADKKLLGTFSANLELLPAAAAHPDTLEWWPQHPQAWEAASNRSPPASRGDDRVRGLARSPAGRASVRRLSGGLRLHVRLLVPDRFAGRSPFSFSALDIKTMAMVMLRKDYRRSVKSAMPRRWFDELPHTHVALDDALEQGSLFCNMLGESRAR